MGLSQQKLADLMDVKRGKVAGYFYKTQSKADFHQKLIDHFHIELGKFLTLEMNEINYESFFSTDFNTSATINEPPGFYETKSDVIGLLLQAKNSPDKTERDQLIDRAIGASGKLISENSELKDKLMESLKKSGTSDR